MRPRLAAVPLFLFLMVALACTVYRDRPARTLSEATGGEGLERVFWKQIQAGNWVELDRTLASNYIGMAPGGALNRAATLDQYRQWKLKEYALGDLTTELNGSTIVVAYTVTLNGTAGGQPLPSAPQHMMSVWQQEKSGWVMIAHSVTQP